MAPDVLTHDGGAYPRREALAATIRSALQDRQVVALGGERGLGRRASAADAVDAMAGWEALFADGNWHRGGYLAGFQELVDWSLAWAEANAPDLVSQHEQTLKRILPARESAAFRVPKDLTNTASRDERTRFYHYEYQNKLVVGLAEFLTAILSASGRLIVLVIDGTERLSPTVRSLLTKLSADQSSRASLRFVLIGTNANAISAQSAVLDVPGYPVAEFDSALGTSDRAKGQRALLHRLSGGNLRLGRALLRCMEGGISGIGHLSTGAVIDLYLASLTADERASMAVSYVRGELADDLLAEQCAERCHDEKLDEERRRQNDRALDRFFRSEGPLVTIHALSMTDRLKRAEALVRPCEILMAIGLYDTWFDIFAELFADPSLRTSGDGETPLNGLFINAAFVLYAMGNVAASVPFLEEFLAGFPKSRFIPTALYAQSMTYARYQVPVDLPRAEKYAVMNLHLIDTEFKDHPKYRYIKVFAENAFAYIKARQGKFDEALALCERGIDQVVATYGEDVFTLHRSILVYNTSQVWEILGQLDQAEAKLRQAIALDPYYAEYHNDLGNLLSRIYDREREALDAYGRAIELSPPYYEAHLNRAVLLTQIGRDEEAFADFERVLEIKPEEWQALRGIADLKLRDGDPQAACALYLAALDYQPDDPDLHANLGLARSEMEDSETAIRHYQKAIALRPSHAEAHNNLAAELVKLRAYREALDHAELASRHGSDPDYARNRALIADLCEP